MNSKTMFLIAFILGAMSGTAVTWYSVKKKYELLAQEEIDSVKEVFARREQESAKDDVDAAKVKKLNNIADIKECESILHREGYTRYSDSTEENEGRETNRHYVISPEQFGENEDYEQISLTYFADQVLADENDEMIEDVEERVGFESLSHFGEYEDDSVFVRNDDRKCDYEILMDQRLYSDVIKGMPRQMEV